MLHYAVSAHRVDETGSQSQARLAVVPLDTSLAGRDDALNPVELLLSALAACMIKGVERAAPLLNFEFSGVELHLDERSTRRIRVLWDLLEDLGVQTLRTPHDGRHRSPTILKWGSGPHSSSFA